MRGARQWLTGPGNHSAATRRGVTLLAATAAAAGWLWPGLVGAAPRLDELRVPAGFRVELAADKVDSARQLALGSDGTLYVGSQRAGNVYALLDADGDGRYETRHVIAKRLSMPSGIALRGNDLYVAAVNEVWRFPEIRQHLDSPRRELVTDRLPDARHHGWKYLGFGPDGALYVPVGAPCNVCLHEDDDARFASLLRMDPDTGASTVFAQGIRNSVGFDWHPRTGELWFTDNGRDMLGDDVPADEVNVITAPGQHFGFPFVHAGDIPDPEFGGRAGRRTFTPPRLLIQAHAAALGVAFYPAAASADVTTAAKPGLFPQRYHGALFITEHGSWNRSSKVGYRVSVALLDGTGQVSAHEPFLTGFLRGERAWGRPNDVLVAHDGSLLVSDDAADAVYRVRYVGDPATTEQAAW